MSLGMFDDNIGGQAQTPYGGIRIQTSTAGVVISVIFGTTRVTGNLIWSGDFQANPVSSGGGGKGGGGKGSVSSYDYTASFAMGICEGPIQGIGRIWDGKNIYNSPTDISNMAVFLGAYPQLPWSYLTANHPSQALPYSGLAYAAIPNYDMGSSNSLPNHSFEIEGLNILGGTQVSVAVYTVPDETPYNVQVVPYNYFVSDGGCVYQSTGIPFVKVGSNPGIGQYALGTGTDAGDYYFSSGDSGNNIIITYTQDMLDANPATILTQIITNSKFGIFPSFPIDVTDYSNWCLAANLLLSPAFTTQQTMSQFIDTILEETFSTAILHDGKIFQIKTYGDLSYTGNGVTWNPDLTPLYALVDDNFVGEKGTLPITCTRKSSADSYNDVKAEFLDRANAYNVGIAEFSDQGQMDQYMKRPDNTHQYHDICQAGIAQLSVTLNGQRNLYVRNKYEFTLDWRFDLLECMDIVTLTDPGLGLNGFPVRIIEIEEDEKFNRKITAEEFPQGIGSAVQYPVTPPVGYINNTNVDPGNINTPLIFDAPGILTQSGYEVWAAVSGGQNWGGCNVWLSIDNTTYKMVGTVYGGSRYGVLTTTLPVASDPDTVDTLGVNLFVSEGILLSGTQADADNAVTLCMINNEFISYETSTLKSTYNYDLAYLRRGIYNSPIGNHAVGDPFVRLDNTIFKYPFPKTMLGSTIYLKFQSFNKYSLNAQDISLLPTYPYVIGFSTSYPTNVTGFNVIQQGDFVSFTWNNIEDQNISGYEIRYVPFGITSWEDGKVVTKAEAGSHIVTSIVPPGNWTFFISAIDASGNYSQTPASYSLVVSNPETIIAGNIDQSLQGWPGTATNLTLHYTGAITLCSQGVAADDDWDTFDKCVPNPYATGTYIASEIALSQNVSARAYALITSFLAPGEISGDPTPAIEMEDHTLGGSYSGFAPWTIGYIVASNVTFEFIITAADGIGVITQFIPVLDGTHVTESYNSIAIAIGGTTVPFNPVFNAPPVVIATVVGAAGLTAVVSPGVTADSCVITTYNAAGVSVAGTVNITATGI